MSGGYDQGYKECPCFWGREPGSVLTQLDGLQRLNNLDVLDLGCGEGKNAAWLADRGCRVLAIDVSEYALENARRLWQTTQVTWAHQDVSELTWRRRNAYDLIIAYGLMHCLRDREQVSLIISAMKYSTRTGGVIVLVAFNDRSQDLSAAHPGFDPLLLSHSEYEHLLADWELIISTDRNLFETHPHNGVPHHHSMTRMAARKTQE
jgi:2-polyprenyl-3-methyl-5-hydroxy-6-metoxy-1,4-benzoquinol methylase